MSTSAACLATTPVCRCGRISTPLHSLIVLVTAAMKAIVVKVSLERIELAVDRLPVAARRRAEDVIGDLDAVVAETLRGLRPIPDLRWVGANVARREEGVQQHRRLLGRGTEAGTRVGHCSQTGWNLANIVCVMIFRTRRIHMRLPRCAWDDIRFGRCSLFN